MNFLGPQPGDHWVESEEVDVFHVVIGSIVLLEFFGRLSWIDAFQNTHLSEVFEG